MDKRLTYFTPTYNRAHDLPKLYESLCNQTNKDFIWLIIDDGSKDNTRELVDGWIKENRIEIDYVCKENGGKNTAIDLSNQICKTEYVNCIDSDDFVSEDSTEVLYKYFDEVSGDDSLCGIVGRRAKYNGEPFNETFAKNKEKIYFSDLKKKYGYIQDTNLIFKISVVKKFHFPIFENEKFVTESVLYNQFMYDYKMLAIPELLYLAEYQGDGYTAQGVKLFFKNPEGYLYALKQNAFLAIRHKLSLKKKVGYTSIFYAWKKALKLKERYPKDNKLPAFYRMAGGILSVLFVGKYKKEYRKFREDNGKK